MFSRPELTRNAKAVVRGEEYELGLIGFVFPEPEGVGFFIILCYNISYVHF